MTFDARAEAHARVRGDYPWCSQDPARSQHSTDCEDLTAALSRAFAAGQADAGAARAEGREAGLREAAGVARSQDDGDSATGRRSRFIARAIEARLSTTGKEPGK